ncbi:MauE/DoxX family redox-associated membrane protein [Streptomyces sp. NPDC090075]|uniref:MauE/DoxX family redox-associated membrane protein n=1 Tax=Streptomyces sp. NPDC090075 TaxID=3365937 RepID=UPI0037FD810F
MELWQAFGKIFLGGMFIISAASKLRDFKGFRSSLTGALPVNSSLAFVVAVGTPAAEILVSVAIWFGRTAYFGFLAATLLLTAFTVYISYLLRAGTKLACSCFGSSTRPVSGVHLGRNVVLLLVSGGCLFSGGNVVSPAMDDYLYVLAPSVIGLAIVARLDDISTFFGSPTPGSF